MSSDASLPASQEPRTELLEELLAGCLRFMASEMQWEFFRSEMFESDNKQSISYRNGVKLQEFLRRPEYVQIWDDLKQKGLIKSR